MTARKLTLATATSRYLDELTQMVTAGKMSQATLANRGADLPHLVEFLGAETDVKKVQAKRPLVGRDTGVYLAPVFTAYVAAKPGCTGAHDRFAKSVSAFFSWLVANDVLATNPAAGRLCPTKPATHKTRKANRLAVEAKQAETFQTDEAVKAGLRSWQSPQLVTRNRALVSLLLNSGIRVAEFCDAKVEDLTCREDGTWWLTVIGKDKKERSVPLPASVVARVHAYHAERKHASPFLFTSLRGQQLTRKAVSVVVADVTGGKLTPHGCRHTAATILIKKMDVHQVAKVLGHESIETTKGYLDVFDADLAAAVADHA